MRILAEFGLGEVDLIAVGGESFVYALGRDRILRIPRRVPREPAATERLQWLLGEIEGRLPFATPVIEAVGAEGRYTIEKRLPGRALSERLGEIAGPERSAALRSYFAAVSEIGRITFLDRPFGDLVSASPITADDWTAYVRASLERYVSRNSATIEVMVGGVEELKDKAFRLLYEVAPLPPKALVHGDYFPGNVLMDDGLNVTAVVDFSPYTVVGDSLLDVAGAVIFLEMIEECGPADVATVRAAALDRYGTGIIPALRFYRAYFAFAMADPANASSPYPKLFPWSLENLRALRDDRLPF